MALYNRTELKTLLEKITSGTTGQVFLCFGERYLCREAAKQIEQNIMARGGGAVHTIDGTTEDDARLLSRITSFSLLPGRQIYRVDDTRLFLSKEVGENIWQKAVKAHQDGKENAAARNLGNLLNLAAVPLEGSSVFSDISSDQWQKLFGFSYPDINLGWADELLRRIDRSAPASSENSAERIGSLMVKGFPAGNVLLLLTETVDKRKKLFNQIKEHGEIIDCSVPDGASRAAVKVQQEVIRELALKTLAQFDKSIAPDALEQLFERVGFHPVAVVVEMEKLAMFVDDRKRITMKDLDQMVSRTREDAIFELTEALGSNNAARTLIILNRLLKDGLHGLAILASIRNYLRKLLILRSIQQMQTPAWGPGMSAHEFQHRYLPSIKETGVWPDQLKGHPYALFMSFKKAGGYSIRALKLSLALLLEAEYRLKGEPIPQEIVLEELLLSLIRINTEKGRSHIRK